MDGWMVVHSYQWVWREKNFNGGPEAAYLFSQEL